MIEALGYVSAVLLALCGLPLVIGTGRAGRVFLWTWFLGELGMVVYTELLANTAADLCRPYFLNYAFNTLLVGYLLARRERA